MKKLKSKTKESNNNSGKGSYFIQPNLDLFITVWATLPISTTFKL